MQEYSYQQANFCDLNFSTFSRLNVFASPLRENRYWFVQTNLLAGHRLEARSKVRHIVL
jgi:hypothetical protein